MSDSPTPDESRGELWFECRYCDTSWHKDTYNDIRHAAANHLNEDHSDDLRRRYDRVETETRDGYHIQGNKYAMTRITIYVTPFDILQPAVGRPFDLVTPSESNSVCKRCGQRVPWADSDVERVEDDPDSILSDDWTCSTCVAEQDVDAKQETNKQLSDFTVQ